MFKTDDIIYHEKYGVGKVIENDGEYCSVVFDFTDSDFKGSTVREPGNLCLLSDAIKIGDRVYNPCYGYGTIEEIQEDEYGKIRCIVDFDNWLGFKYCTTKQYREDGIMVLEEFRDKKIYEPRLSLSVLLEELGEKEKIDLKHLEELKNIILDTVKKWRKEYGYYKEIRY